MNDAESEAGESADEFGVTCRRWMPLSWRVQQPLSRTPERVAWVNDVAARRLQTLLDRETRDRPSSETANLEALLIEVLHCVKQVPASRTVELGADRIEWVEPNVQSELHPGATGIIRMAPDPDLPYEIELCADITSVKPGASGRLIRADLVQRSSQVTALYRQLVFVYYRRARRTARQKDEKE